MAARWLRRWAEIVYRRRVWVLAASALISAGSLFLALRLPILTDTSVLLPPNARSVQDLRAIEKRVRAASTILVILQAPDEASRAAAAEELRTRLASIPTELVSEMVDD